MGVDEVGEPPDVAEADGVTQGREDKVALVGPLAAVIVIRVGNSDHVAVVGLLLKN